MLPAADHRPKQKGCMPKSLPSGANLDQLKKQAKELLKSLKAADSDAKNCLGENAPNQVVSLHDAQRVIAREYGFASWTKLKQHVDALQAGADAATQLRVAIMAR